jgi:predicted dehydrogenase
MVRVGLLGVGAAGAVHARAFAHLLNAELVAVADVDRAAVDRLAAATSARPYYGILPLLDDPDVAVVDVCLPVRVREQAVVAAAGAGKHILCETPLALNLAGADRMQMAIARAGVQAMVLAPGRFWSPYTVMRDWLQAGRVGAPRATHVTGLASWTAGGAFDRHVHDLDLLYGLFGPPARVQAAWVGTTPDAASPLDDFVTRLDYGAHQAWAESGILASDAYPFTMNIRLVGEGGVLEYRCRAVPQGSALVGEDALWAYLPGQPPQRVATSRADAYEEGMAYFIDCIERGQPPALGTLSEARAVLNVALAAVQSAETGQTVDVTGQGG